MSVILLVYLCRVVSARCGNNYVTRLRAIAHLSDPRSGRDKDWMQIVLFIYSPAPPGPPGRAGLECATSYYLLLLPSSLVATSYYLLLLPSSLTAKLLGTVE